MPILWEWIPERSIEIDIEFRHDGMTSGGAYGDVQMLTKKKPIISANFEGRGFTESDSDALFAAAALPSPAYSLTDFLGNSWAGTIKSVSESPTNTGCVYKTLKLTLVNAVKT